MDQNTTEVVVDETKPDSKAVDVGVRDTEIAYGDHMNQKFGNTPANPKHAPGTENEETVLMGHKTNNIEGVGTAFKNVPKSMVGDYARAGWHVSTGLDDTGDDVGIGAGATDDAAGRRVTALTEEIGTDASKAKAKDA